MEENHTPTFSRQNSDYVSFEIALDQTEEIPNLTDESLPEPKKKKVQAKATKSTFTVVLQNELRTKNMRVVRSVHRTVQEPTLDKKLVAKVPEYFVKAYPFEERQKYQIYNNA